MPRRSPWRILVCAALGAMAAPIATILYVSHENEAVRTDRAELDLIDDLVSASQAVVSAERMISMGRAYVITHEPDLLARAHAAQAKLQQTLRELEMGANALHERPLFDSVHASAHRYGETFDLFLADNGSSGTPHEVAETLRRRVIPARDRLEGDLEELIAHRQQQIARLRASSSVGAAGVVPVMVGICVLGVLASILLARAALQRAASAVAPSSAEDSEALPDGWPTASGEYGRERPGAPPDRRSGPSTRRAARVLHFPRRGDE